VSIVGQIILEHMMFIHYKFIKEFITGIVKHYRSVIVAFCKRVRFAVSMSFRTAEERIQLATIGCRSESALHCGAVEE